MRLDWLIAKLQGIYLCSLVLLGVFWVFDVPIRLNLGVVTASYISLMLAISIAAGFLLKPFSDSNKSKFLDILFGFLAILSWGWVSINYVSWLTDLANRGIEKWVPGVIALLLLISHNFPKLLLLNPLL